MKILYGVQGTGNGHTTRARAMAPALRSAGAEVDFLFSGRDPDQFFDMGVFGDYRVRQGLTFVTRDGRIAPLATLAGARPRQFFREIKELSLSHYDLVISDFEPVTAWAARRQRAPLMGLGHQYAFRYPIPQHHGGLIQRQVFRHFAPTPCNLGLHWHHFDQPILPPIAPVDTTPGPVERDHYLVYLPFESTAAIGELLARFPGYRFSVYHPRAEPGRVGAVQWHRPGWEPFHTDLRRCEGVICNAGFELASEVLQLGRKLLVRPLRGQSEQYSNALALDVLGYGHVMYHLDPGKVDAWLATARGVRVQYPDVARRLSRWIVAGDYRHPERLAASLWAETRYPDVTATWMDRNYSDISPDIC